MIVRSIARRQGWLALASTSVPRTHQRFITQDTTRTGLTAEALESVTNAAALNQVPSYDSAVENPKVAAGSKPISAPRGKDNVAESWKDLRRLQKSTASIGSNVERRYVPDELIEHPPAPEDVTLELLMASQTHMGHNTARWNPANSRYIYGVRQGIHIVDLETTLAHLRRAARVVEEVAFRGGLILFVGTRKGQMDVVTKAARLSGACHLFTKWTPGGITNRDVILRDKELRMVDERDQAVDGFDEHIRDRRPVVPDLVVCLNPLENYTLLYECGLASVPTIGVIDTDADPSWVTYAIPANDDSLRSISLIGGVLGRAGQAGQRRRLGDAEAGQVHWETPAETRRYMERITSKWQTEMSAWEEDMARQINEQNREKGKTGRLLENMTDEAARKEMVGQ